MTRTKDHSFRIPRRGALVALAVPAALAVLPSLAQAAPAGAQGGPRKQPTGYLYTNLNTAGTNSVGAFKRNADGSLTSLTATGFAVGGSGTSMAPASQGAIQTAFGGRLLLVADPGSNQISVLWINQDGSLNPAGGSPFSSGGNLPISIAVHANLVYVANVGNPGDSNYTGFRLGRDGGVSPIPGSTFPLPDGSQPGDVLFDATGRHLVGTRVSTSLIDSFGVDPSGRIFPQGAVPFAAQGLGPFGSAFRPNGAPQLYVTNAHNGGTNLGTVSAFHVSPDGRLASIGASPYPDNQNAPCWAAISPDSHYLFLTNTGSSSISSFSIAGDGSLSLVGSTPLTGTGLAALDLAVDPSGRYVYVVDRGATAVHALAINPGGSLTELATSPFALPANTQPFGIAMT